MAIHNPQHIIAVKGERQSLQVSCRGIGVAISPGLSQQGLLVAHGEETGKTGRVLNWLVCFSRANLRVLLSVSPGSLQGSLA